MRFRPSPLAALGAGLTAVLAVVAVLAPFLIGAWWSEGAPPAPGGLLARAELLFALVPAVAPVAKILCTRYTIDEQGIREEVRFLTTTDRRVPWEKVTALRHRRTLFDRLLGLERIDAVAYGTRGTTVHLVGLRDAPALRDRISARMRQEASVASLLRAD